ncbi:hypothetical protein [Blastopirellula marina]|uniref:Uncharacterized protein n=1 Tax=Blastopirellula marina DSM 3645 TaxID=314230 RepID=A3ZXH6_9BACT|nr:hypothetical protein [Blastopirellula marina]EAQ78766.1 hypothetical protein DSM3645_29731 [Blastopirellula marina DSM 3645]
MLNSLCDEMPKLTNDEIQARCEAIRMNWSSSEKIKRKIDGERRIRALDRTLRQGSVEVNPRRSYAGVVHLARMIAG